MTEARIFIADDHEIFRRGLRTILELQQGWKVIGDADNGRTAVESVLKLNPDVTILDVSMPELNGLEALRQIKKEAPETRVIILTLYDTEIAVRDALEAGAESYILKADASQEMVKAVHSLLQNKPYFSGKIAKIVLEGYLRKEGRAAIDVAQLSDREREVVQLLAEGRSNKQVAESLGISVKTAETHRSNLMRKMEFTSIVDLVRYAVRNRIVTP